MTFFFFWMLLRLSCLCLVKEGGKLAPVSEAEVRAAFTARLGMPLTGQIMPGTLPFYPTLPGITEIHLNTFVKS